MGNQAVEDYVSGVLSSDIVACQWIKLVVQRYLHDLDHAGDRGFYFDEDAAQRPIDFCGLCTHYKGEFAGQQFEPEPWQQFFLWNLFGWKREDGTRRFRQAYLEVARKNGKTFFAAVIGLYLACADGESGAEIYTVATKRDQARLCHRDAIEIVKRSPALKQFFNIFRDNLSITETASKFEPLGRDSDSMDGLNVSGAILDELHAWKNRDLFDVIDTATGARTQPLIFAITTAGFNRQSICWEHHSYLQQILAGHINDDHFFGAIYTLDDEQEFNDFSCWQKSNPNLGISVNPDDIKRKIKQAESIPARLNGILRLHFNIWTQAESRWIDWQAWSECGKRRFDVGDLFGRVCFGGLDLSSTTDISAFVLVFPPERDDEPYKILPRFWIPDESMHERSRRDKVPYESFVENGHIVATDGNVIDYSYIIDQICRDHADYDLREVAFDRWGATKIVNELSDAGVEVIQFGQGFASMSPPMKELEKLILSQKIAHNGNPVLNWMAGNVVAREDPAGNIKPDKSRSIEKIDGIVAMIMALDRALYGENVGLSIYADRGLLVI